MLLRWWWNLCDENEQTAHSNDLYMKEIHINFKSGYKWEEKFIFIELVVEMILSGFHRGKMTFFEKNLRWFG
jgi:hypothetical protein